MALLRGARGGLRDGGDAVFFCGTGEWMVVIKGYAEKGSERACEH